jgi:hypothetical protein
VSSCLFVPGRANLPVQKHDDLHFMQYAVFFNSGAACDLEYGSRRVLYDSHFFRYPRKKSPRDFRVELLDHPLVMGIWD